MPGPARPTQEVRILVASPIAAVERDAGETRIYPAGLPGDERPAATRIVVEERDSRVRSVVLERSSYTGDQLYYAFVDGQLLISDLFGLILDRIPVERRDIRQSALVDHMLFRTTPGEATLIEAIHRLGHGQVLTWRPGAEPTVRSPKVAPAPRRPPDAAAILDGLDRALTESVAGPREGSADLFSGGVDSTLLHSYLGPGVDTVNVATDSPEFRPEVEYARHAEALLRVRAVHLEYHESSYRDLLTETIRDMALPPHHVQTVSIGLGFTSGHQRYWTAQFADALFGLGAAGHAHTCWKLKGAVRLHPLAPLLPLAARKRFATLRRTVTTLHGPAPDPDSFAQSFAVYSNVPEAREIFGDEAVLDRFRHRARYTRDVVQDDDEVTGSGFLANLTLGHWIDFLCDDTVALWKQLALSRGVTLDAPFTHPSVVRGSHAIPPGQRYFARGTTKYWLKTLLRRRVPAYPVKQPKYSSGLPIWRYFRDGPLQHALADFHRPAFVDRRIWEGLHDRPTWNTWNLLTFLIWDSEVRRNRHRDASRTAATELRFRDQPVSP